MPDTSTSSRQLIDTRGVGNRYGGKHPRTIKRWQKTGVIPKPDQIINNRSYWYSETLEACDRQRVIDAAQGTTSRTKP